MRVDGMGDAHPLMVREPRQYARLRWAGENWGKGGGKRKAIGARQVHTPKGNAAFRIRFEVDTAAGTG